jgi:hypothetical protein
MIVAPPISFDFMAPKLALKVSLTVSIYHILTV